MSRVGCRLSLSLLALTTDLVGQVQLHPRVARWRQVYLARGWQAFLEEMDRDLPPPVNDIHRHRYGRSGYADRRAASTPPRRPPDEAFWARLSHLEEPHPAATTSGGGPQSGGEGGGAASLKVGGADPKKFRGTTYIAPFASEWLGSFTLWKTQVTGSQHPCGGVPCSGNPLVKTADALRAVEVHAAFLQRMGVNVVRLAFPYGAYRWWQSFRDVPSVTEYGDYLRAFMDRLNRHGIRVIVALGNTFGDDPLDLASQQTLNHQDHWSPGAPILPAGTKYLVYDEAPWIYTSFFQEPSNTLVDTMASHTFFTSEFYPYVSWLVSTIKDRPNLVCWELYNEPDFGALNQANMAAVIEQIRVRVRDPQYGGDAATPLALSGTPQGLEVLGQHLSPDGNDWIADNIDWLGLHVQNAAMYRSGDYSLSEPRVGYAGFPPKAVEQTVGLLNHTAPPPTVNGALSFFYNFMDLHGLEGFVEEACVRTIFPQMLHDLDIACRVDAQTGLVQDPLGVQKVGLVNWTSAYAPFGSWLIAANGGGTFVPRETLSMKDRNRVGNESTTNSDIDALFLSVHTGITSGGRIFPAPTTPNASRALRPLVLRSGDKTLLVAADPFDDVPNVTHYQDSQSVTQRASARNKIWVLALRPGGFSSGVADLQTKATAAAPYDALATLSADLRFKEVDDNLPIASHGPALRYRHGFFSIDPLSYWIFNYPTGFVSIDPVWSFNTGTSGAPAMKTPTLDLPSVTGCNGSSWTSSYVVELGSSELEFTLRGQMYVRTRGAHLGVGGAVSGIALAPSGDTGRFLIAYHRAVPRKIGAPPGLTFPEHYGPGQDAASTTSDELTWSARYGDHYRKVPYGSQAVGEPEKYEIVLVDISVTTGLGSTLDVAAMPSVLPTNGDNPTTAGASGLDPLLAVNDQDDIAIFYRKVQDPSFFFKQVKETGVNNVRSINGAAVGQCTTGSGVNPQTMLPIPYANGVPMRWSASMTDPATRFDIYPSVLAARFRRPPATVFGAEKVVSEPFDNSSGTFAETWSTWLKRTRNVREYGGAVYQFLDPGSSAYSTGWVTDRPSTSNPNLPDPLVDTDDPQSWHPVFPASVQVGPRIGTGSQATTPILLAWKQMPRERRQDFKRPSGRAIKEWPAYAVYALRLSGDAGSALAITSADYERFGSHEGMQANTNPLALKDPLLTTWDQPAVSFTFKQNAGGGTPAEQDTGDVLAFWQQTWRFHRQTEGQAQAGVRPPEYPAPNSLGANDHAILHAPVTGYEPRNANHPSEALRITAWCVPNGQKTKIRYQWQRGATTSSSDVFLPNEAQIGGDFETTDPTVPDVKVVAVLPWVRAAGGQPVGRIIWQADRDVWIAEIFYGVGSPAHKCARITPPGQRDYPYLSAPYKTVGRFPVHLTEVSATGDVMAWTYDGNMHIVRLVQVLP